MNERPLSQHRQAKAHYMQALAFILLPTCSEKSSCCNMRQLQQIGRALHRIALQHRDARGACAVLANALDAPSTRTVDAELMQPVWMASSPPPTPPSWQQHTQVLHMLGFAGAWRPPLKCSTPMHTHQSLCPPPRSSSLTPRCTASSAPTSLVSSFASVATAFSSGMVLPS